MVHGPRAENKVLYAVYGGIAQLVEHWIPDPKAVSSSLATLKALCSPTQSFPPKCGLFYAAAMRWNILVAFRLPWRPGSRSAPDGPPFPVKICIERYTNQRAKLMPLDQLNNHESFSEIVWKRG